MASDNKASLTEGVKVHPERRASLSKPESMRSRRKSSSGLRRLRQSSKQEEAKDCLAFKVISEEQTLALKELTPHELEAKLAEILSINDFHISLLEASLLDYYVAGFWFTKEQNFNCQQSSAFFTVLKILIENVKEKQMTLSENFNALKKLFAGIGVDNNCSLSGGLECFNVNQAKVITDYFSDGLFQHYKLYEYLFTKEPEEEVILTDLKIEIAPMANIPFPPPLDEGMTEEIWQEYIMTPPSSPQPDAEEETTEKEESAGQKPPLIEDKKDLVASINPDVIKTIVKRTADDVFGNFKVEVEAKLKERELNYSAKLAKK